MPNPGAFQGSRKAFLISKKPEFRRSVTFGYTAELLGTIQREYFKRYPIDLPHNEEPSAEHLAAVDDDAPDPEFEEPDEKSMTPEEYKAAMEIIARRRKEVIKRKAQIKRWFIYQYMKDNDGDPRDQRAFSPYCIFLSKLRGGDGDKPRRKSAVNVWRKFHRERIDKLAKLTAARENIGKSGMASLRDKVAHDLFEGLKKEEQQEWTTTALEEHKEALKEWADARSRGVSTEPADRQRAIQGLVRFVQPVLDVIADATGWKVCLFAGGPEPAQDGMLNVISVHSGTTSGDVKLTFGQSERGAIKKDFIPIFGSFLKKCYSPEECRARALSEMEGFVPVSDMELEGGEALLHPLGPDPVVQTATTTAATGATASATGPSPPPLDEHGSISSITPANPTSAVQPAVHNLSSTTANCSTSTSAPASAAFSQMEDMEVDDVAGDRMDDSEGEGEFPLTYRFPSEGAADSPNHVPSPPPPSRQVSPAPSPPRLPPPRSPTIQTLFPTVLGHSHPVALFPMALGHSLPDVQRGLAALFDAVVPARVPPNTSAMPASDAPHAASATAAADPPSTPSPTNPETSLGIRSTKTKARSAKKIAKATPTSAIQPPKGVVKENVNAVILGTSTSAPGGDGRPQRKVTKTAKAICLEEEMSKKVGRGKKRTQEALEAVGPSDAAPAKRRRATKKASKA